MRFDAAADNNTHENVVKVSYRAPCPGTQKKEEEEENCLHNAARSRQAPAGSCSNNSQ